MGTPAASQRPRSFASVASATSPARTSKPTRPASSADATTSAPLTVPPLLRPSARASAIRASSAATIQPHRVSTSGDVVTLGGPWKARESALRLTACSAQARDQQRCAPRPGARKWRSRPTSPAGPRTSRAIESRSKTPRHPMQVRAAPSGRGAATRGPFLARLIVFSLRCQTRPRPRAPLESREKRGSAPSLRPARGAPETRPQRSLRA